MGIRGGWRGNWELLFGGVRKRAIPESSLPALFPETAADGDELDMTEWKAEEVEGNSNRRLP